MIKFKEIFEQLVEDHTCINCGNIVDENLKQWFKDRWVNIGKKKKGGGHPPCGTSGKKRGYAKCVPAAKAAKMSESQRQSAVKRKRSKAQGVGGKPTNVKTFAKAAGGGMAQRGMRFIGVR